MSLHNPLAVAETATSTHPVDILNKFLIVPCPPPDTFSAKHLLIRTVWSLFRWVASLYLGPSSLSLGAISRLGPSLNAEKGFQDRHMDKVFVVFGRLRTCVFTRNTKTMVGLVVKSSFDRQVLGSPCSNTCPHLFNHAIKQHGAMALLWLDLAHFPAGTATASLDIVIMHFVWTISRPVDHLQTRLAPIFVVQSNRKVRRSI